MILTVIWNFYFDVFLLDINKSYNFGINVEHVVSVARCTALDVNIRLFGRWNGCTVQC